MKNKEPRSRAKNPSSSGKRGNATPLNTWMTAGGVAAAAIGLYPAQAISATEPRSSEMIEKEVLQISKVLKPIPDEIWNSIAGAKGSEKYQIVKGDTLYDISKRLFGDGKYWPKIWSLNNQNITNPHLIRPGNSVAFTPGSGTALPSVTIASNEGGAMAPPSASSSEASSASENSDTPEARAQEWKHLPLQKWENLNVTPPQEQDEVGLGTGNNPNEKIRYDVAEVKFRPGAIAATYKIAPVGTITSSTTPTQHATSGQKVFIQARNESLQIGQTYTITDEPSTLSSSRKQLQGYRYRILGTVLIQDKKDGFYIGKVLSSRYLIRRGSILIPSPPPISFLDRIPGHRPMEAGIIVDPEFSTTVTSQFQQVFLDRGSDDGIKPGMIFEVFLKEDPYNHAPLGNSKLHKLGEIMVLQTSEKFSISRVEKSEMPLSNGMIITLALDPSAPKENTATPSTPHSAPSPHSDPTAPRGDSRNADELERLDQENDSLTAKERRELKQLEKWKKNPPSPSNLPSSSDSSSQPLAPPPTPPAPTGASEPPSEAPELLIPDPEPAPSLENPPSMIETAPLPMDTTPPPPPPSGG